ncbi:MAG: SprB repeat-containing protein [Ferruginibacter sp.]
MSISLTCRKGLFIFILSFLIACLSASGQLKKMAVSLKNDGVFTKEFVKNIGQYGERMKGFEEMGKIQYGYEGLGMPVLFTAKGLIHLHRKTEKISHEEEEKLERQGVPEEDIERRKNITDRTITMEWLNANRDVEIIATDQKQAYHTYGLLPDKAYGYKKITYKNIYPGVDLLYSFTDDSKIGFEYSLLVQPGADISRVKLKYGGDIKSLKKDSRGNLVIRSDIDGFSISVPVSYYSNKLLARQMTGIKTDFKISNKEISFFFPQGYDSSKPLVIDPFVSSTSNLVGANAGKAIDVDYDYEGNIYVAGGGAVSQSADATHSHAKYNSSGTLLWTFNGLLTIPSWQAGYYYGGWVVDKGTGALYIGQGFAYEGFRVIRVSTTGLYDNYISTGNPAFQEAWKMYWFCNNGTPQIICAGGGTTGNTNFAICSPPSTTLLASANLTGSPVAGQDMTDLVIDPVTNSLYTIYASPLDFNTANKIFKNNPPYSAATRAWSTFTGYSNVIEELRNRPYINAGYNDNSSNILGQNANYIFYWDGLNLKAFNKATGAVTGTPLSLTGNAVLMQGGIVADACDNIYIGNKGGIIKVYKFNGSVFDDAAAPDISVPGYTSNVYDLALDESKKLLYASGDGFVASIDIASYCPNTIYTVNIVSNCATGSATATISPVPLTGSTINYTLFSGTTQISTNTTGIFTGLNPNITYTVVATINRNCSGTQATGSFVLPGPDITAAHVNTICGASTGSITAAGSGVSAPGPYSYSLNGGAFQPSGNFTGLAAGIYNLIIQSSGGCLNDTVINILNSNGPVLTFTQTDATCGNNAGTVTASATGGNGPYQFSINGGTSYQAGNFFTGLVAGQYTLVVKDADACTNSSLITIATSPAISLTAISGSATCGQANGTITAFATGGSGALQFSINGNTFQAATLFSGLTPGTYTVTVKDAIGCIASVSVTVANAPVPGVTAVSTPAACGNRNGVITATGVSGVSPYQYSINGGVSYQVSNVFTGLASGNYTITIKDATGCTNVTTIAVASTNGPAVTATTTVSSCASNTGSITIAATGGVLPYQYSINGTTFVATATFSALAPGNYVAYVRDNAGCISTLPVVVSGIAGPTLTATSTAASCTVNDGTITATGGGTAPPLEYSINGTNYFSSGSFTGLAPGIYFVYVRDANGCIRRISVSVASVGGLALTVSAISASCSLNNGTLTATGTGGTGTLTYSMDGITYTTVNVFNNLAAGNYTVYVKDANACVVSRQAIVAAAATFTFTVTIVQQATCGSASGAVMVNANGGVAPLTYNIDGGAFQPVNAFVNLATGTHTFTVKDATGCITASQSVTITNSGTGTPPADVTFRIANVVACTGEGRIKNIRGLPSGGGNSYEFSLDGGPFTTSNQFRPVSAGVHIVTAMNDESFCTVSRIAIVGSGPPATATATVTPSTCAGSTGSITLTGVGINTPYHSSIDNGITWQNFAATFTYTGLAAGTYSIIMADDADFVAGPPVEPGACLTTIFVAVPTTGGPTISTTQTPGTCNAANGSISATGGGTSGPYTYSIDGNPYTASGAFTNLAAGIHAVTIMDGAGCITGVNVSLTSPSSPAVTAVIATASCNLNNGTITATVTGGVGPYEYSINGTVFLPTNTFNGIAPGSYTVWVKDATGCLGTTNVTITATPRVRVTAFTIAASCGMNDGTVVATGTFGTIPYTFSLDGLAYQSSGTFNNLAAGFYTIYIKDARGCITTTGVSVSNLTAPTIATTATAATCGNTNGSITVTSTGGSGTLQYSIDGINFQLSNSFPGLAPGNYTATVKDANGCINTKAVLISDIPGPHTLNAAVVDAACGSANGSITAAAAGGTGALQYSINGTNYFAGPIFSGLAAGSYTLYVRDANLCVRTRPVTVSNLAGPGLTVTTSPASCGASDGTITAIASGGSLALAYSRNGGVTYQASNIFTGLPSGTYTIMVRDARTCISTATVTVPSAGGPAISASSTAATCNGGSITITAASGVAPYSYSINGTVYQASNIFTGLGAGTYTAYVRDALLCVSSSGITVGAPVGTAGTWTGEVDADWFNCSNWQAGTVPTSLIDVIIPASANKPVIDPLSPYAATYGGIATAKNLTIDTDTLIFKINAQLQVAGNVTIQNNAQVDMLAGGAADIKGNWINNVGANGFAAGSGRIVLSGNTAQSIFTIAANETFNELFVNHTGTGVSLLKNTTVSNTLEITQGLLAAGTNTLNGGLLRMTGGTLRLAKNGVILPELSTYNLTGGSVDFNGTGVQTIRPINYFSLISSSSGPRMLSAAGITGIAAVFTPGTNIYTITGSAVHFNGNSNQLVPPVNTGAAAPYTNQYNILLLSGSNTKTAAGNFTIIDSLKVNTGATFSIGSNIITLKSDNNKTARIAGVEGTVTPALSGGHYIVERYIPAHDPPKRAWRFITAPVVSTQSVNAAWQEAASPSTSGATPPSTAINQDPSPGYGTHISGTGAALNGFDQTPLNNASVKFYDPVNNIWDGIPNTSMALTSHAGYMNFVRGSRSYPISTSTAATVPSGTVLRAKGNLKTYAQSFSGSSWQVIGNPYASAINLHNTVKTGAVADAYYVWDPLVASPPQSPNGVGAYLPIIYLPGTGYVTAIDPNLPGPSYHPYDIDGTIQSGAAFFMNFGAGGTLTINETDKVAGSNNYQFRHTTDQLPQLRAALYLCNADSSLNYLADGVLQVFDASFPNTVTALDLPKAKNFSENFSIQSAGHFLSIETRKPLHAPDTVFYDFKNQKLGIYCLKFYASAVCPPAVHAFIEDTYTGRRQLLNTDGETSFNFSISNVVASQRPDRIRIVFKNNGVVLPLTKLTLRGSKQNGQVLLEWQAENELDITGYEIERSADGVGFLKIGDKPASAGMATVKNYSWPDEDPQDGYNHYRLKYTSAGQLAKYSQVVTVKMDEGKKGIFVSPNPFDENIIKLFFNNMPKAVYHARLFDNDGKLLLYKSLQHTGVNSRFELKFDLFKPGSVYELEITHPLGKTVIRILSK